MTPKAHSRAAGQRSFMAQKVRNWETKHNFFFSSDTSLTGASSSFQMEDLSFSNSALTCVNCLAQKSFFFFSIPQKLIETPEGFVLKNS